MARKVAFYTLGCKANQYDTAVLIAAFKKRGYDVVDFGEEADVYVINTCAVTGRSEAKSRQAIRRAKRLNPDAVVCVSGCYPQVAADRITSMPEVDVVAGTTERSSLPDRVDEYLRTGRRLMCVGPVWSCRSFEEAEALEYQGRTRAFLKIEDGCDHFCTYCIVPFARGPVRSLPPERVLEEARRLATAGFREIVLTGIHLGRYGKDLRSEDGRGVELADVLRSLNDVEGLERIRLSSVEPQDITPALVDAVAGLKKVCPHLHVPLQSGSDRILEAMNRGYTSLEYLELVEDLRGRVADLGLTTDVIVGFPGETEEDFLKTCDVVRAARFSRLHVFPYSAREGTRAASMGDQVPRTIREQRSRSLIRLGKQLSYEFHKNLVGRTVRVLVEEHSAAGLLEGFTGNYVRVRFPGPNEVKGKFVDIVVRTATAEGVGGEMRGRE